MGIFYCPPRRLRGQIGVRYGKRYNRKSQESCVYSNIVVVGKKENIQIIVDALQEMQMVMKEIAGQIQSGGFSMSEKSYQELKGDYLALVITVLDIVDGAAYLFQKEPPSDRRNWKAELELEQLRHVLKQEEKSAD